MDEEFCVERWKSRGHAAGAEHGPLIMMVTAGACEAGDAPSQVAVVWRARLAAQAGVDLVQIREPHLAPRELLALVTAVLRAVEGDGVHVLVNRRVDVALASGAHGVHLPETGVDASRVRAVAPDGFLVGRSVHHPSKALRASRKGGYDYLVFGTVYPSASKPAGSRVAGVAALGEACAAVDLPVLAIGGVSPATAHEVAAAGAAGIAAITAFEVDTDDESSGTDSMRRVVAALRAPFARRPAS